MTVLNNNQDFNTVFEPINFTDAFVREFYSFCPSFMHRKGPDQDSEIGGCDIGAYLYLLILLVHDTEHCAVEFIFKQAGGSSLGFPGDLFLSSNIDEWAKTVFLTEDKTYYASGKHVCVNLLGEESLGPRLRYGNYPADSNAVEAKIIEGDWRICSHCHEAWQEQITVENAVCPACFYLTILKD